MTAASWMFGHFFAGTRVGCFSNHSAVNELLDLPYTSVVHVHQWLGASTLWATLVDAAFGHRLPVEAFGYRTLTIATARAVACKPGQFMRVAVPTVSAAEYHGGPSPTPTAAPSPSSSPPPPARATNGLQRSASISTLKTTPIVTRTNPLRVLLQGPFGLPNRLATEYASFHSLVFYVGGIGVGPACRVAALDAQEAAAVAAAAAAMALSGSGY
ncbi:hypothetical protein DFJ73DRAFT_772256 [Zopfochytrium polystomum]|nr:hypothetical protein DFJ73DRAFT_772256 [Zopfochytrium polystomum]